MAKTVVIIQSNYIPWRGYFDMIRQADELLFLDNVQYTRQDWRNRNVIKTSTGPQWLTVPVVYRFPQTIDETRISDPKWAVKHMHALEANYRGAQAFDDFGQWLFGLYRNIANESSLSLCNRHLIEKVCAKLGIKTALRRAEDVLPRREMAAAEPTGRLVDLCLAVGATRYLSGPAAKAYLDMVQFDAAGVEVSWMNYSGYAEYPQCWGKFEPRVSIVDLLLNCGEQSALYLGR